MNEVRAVDLYDRGFGVKKPGDVGHDLYVKVRNQTLLDRAVSFVLRRPVHLLLPVVGTRTVASGVFLAMGRGVWCHLHPRSSIARRKLHLLGGVIDSGFRGELFAVLHNYGLLPRVVSEGERYAQVIFYPALRPFVHVVHGFDDDTHRGTSGFGSTGR